MDRFMAIVLLALAGWLAAPQAAQAQTTVRVLETWPAGQDVRLARNQHFYLRLAYDSDRPVRIWAQAMHRGKPAAVGSSTSRLWSGSGEMMVWFFFMEPGGEVDEVRIVAGDGGDANTPLVATWRGRVVAGSAAAAPGAVEPRWVVDMREQSRLARQQDYEARMAEPSSAGDTVLGFVFGLAVVVLGLAGFVAPLWAVRRWQGGWRVAAMLPLGLMGFVVLRIVVETAIDPTSHNLWPFEILIAGAIGGCAMLALVIARRLSGAGRQQ